MTSSRETTSICLLVVLGLLLGCQRDPSEIDRVVLISIDTLRADALGCYGNEANPSPNIDRLAAEGTRFAQCIAPANVTFPSHATMLTGLHPLQHGILSNSRGRLPAEVDSLAERLQTRGWRTGAVVSSTILHRRYGLDQGFDTYRDNYFSDTFPVDGASFAATDAGETTKQAIKWLQEGGGGHRPEFLFIHYIDPHKPYQPPLSHKRQFPDNPYFGEVAFVDEQIGRLVAFVQSEFGGDHTLWIITSDHGESMGEHEEKSHGILLYDAVVRVPLILSGPGVPKDAVVTEPVGLIDLTPTILALLGDDPDPNLPGRAIATSPPSDRSFVSTSYSPSFEYGWSPIWSLSDRDEKFILSSGPEYYQTQRDPGEETNLLETNPTRARELESQLRTKAADYIATAKPPDTGGVDPQREMELIALGYAVASETMASKALDDFSGENPRDNLDVVDLHSQANFALQQHDFESAEHFLLEMKKRDPKSVAFDMSYPTLLLSTNRNQELVDWIDQKPESFRNEIRSRYVKARALRELGRFDEAIALLKNNLAEDGSEPSSRYELAVNYTLLGFKQEAVAEYAKLLEEDPWNGPGRINYANLLSLQGDTEEAISVLQKLLQQSPDHATAHNNIALFYAKSGQRRDAIHHFLRARGLETDPTRLRIIDQYLARVSSPEYLKQYPQPSP